MATFDREPDELEQEEKELARGGDWNRPLLMAGVGLLLMLGGYAAVSYTPETGREVEQVRQLNELRKMADERQKAGADDALSERLNQLQPVRRDPPPYHLLGRVAIYGGLFLFVMAGVLMYRSSPPPKELD